MKKKEYRVRKVANDYRRNLKHQNRHITPAQAYKETDAIQKVCAALNPLSVRNKLKTLRILQILLED